MIRIKFIVLVSLAITIPSSVLADMFPPRHNCSKPYKPYTFNSQWELDSFIDNVEDYMQCISDFVYEQNAAAETHQQAAREAIDEWNDFVEYELN